MPNETYFIWGAEGYLIARTISAIVLELSQKGDGDPEVIGVEADEMSSLELGQTLEFSPLFVSSRAVIIKNPAWLGKGSRQSRKINESLKVLEDYFGREHPGQVLILTASESNASNPIVKLLHKKAQVINPRPLSLAELDVWCKEELQRRGLKMAPAAVQRMVNSGQDMFYVLNLMDKLALMAGSKTVTVQELEEQLDLRQEIKVFKLTDALLDRNLKGALAAFYQLQEQGEHHLLLLHMIARQYFVLGLVKSCQSARMNRSMIASETGQKDFMIKKMMEKAPHYSPGEIRSGFETLLAADLSFKSESKDPQIIMESLLIEMCSQK